MFFFNFKKFKKIVSQHMIFLETNRRRFTHVDKATFHLKIQIGVRPSCLYIFLQYIPVTAFFN